MANGGGTEAGSTAASSAKLAGTNSAALGLSAAELGLTEAMAVFGRTVVLTC